MTLMQILLEEKQATDDIADTALQPGSITSSGLTAGSKIILGNKEASTGAIEELTLSQALDLVGSATQGAILYRGASAWAALAPGTSGQVFTSGGSSANPAWASAVSGSTVLIEEYIGNGTTGTHTFSSIPGTYRALKLVWQARSSVSALTEALSLRFNADTGSNYDRQVLQAGATSVQGTETFAASSAGIGPITGATAPTNQTGSGRIEIPNYAGTTFFKRGTGVASVCFGTATGSMQVQENGIQWRSTAAISSLTAFLASGNFVTGSKLQLYGVP